MLVVVPAIPVRFPDTASAIAKLRVAPPGSFFRNASDEKTRKPTRSPAQILGARIRVLVEGQLLIHSVTNVSSIEKP